MTEVAMEFPEPTALGAHSYEALGDAAKPVDELIAYDTVPEVAPARESLGMKVLKGSIIVNEMLPTDDVARYGLLAASQQYTHNPLVGAAVLGGATLITEGAAVLAASKWIAEDRIAPILDKTREKIDSFKNTLNNLIPPLRLGRIVPNLPDSKPEVGSKLPITAQAAIALNLGNVVMLEAMQRRDPSRTAEQNRRYGLRGAALVAGYMAVEGALLSTGYNNITDPKYIGPAALGIAGLHYVIHKIRQRAERKRQMVEDTQAPAEVIEAEEAFRPRYDLDQHEIDVLDYQITQSVKQEHPEEGLYAALISPEHPYSNFVRGHEARYFPEVNDFPAELEDNTLLFALVDTRPASDRVVHVGTISGPGLRANPDANPDSTGFLSVDELVGLGNFTPDEFKAFYEAKGLNLDKCIAVETNIRVGEPVEKYHGFRTVDLGYLTLFGLVERGNPEEGEAAVFASVNRASVISFGRVGIDMDPLMDRDDLVTPESFYGRKSSPVAIPFDPAVFRQMGPQLKTVKFGLEES